MSTPQEKIEADIKEAMKARDNVRLGTLRMVLTQIKNDTIAKGEELTDEAFLAVVRKQIKQRQEAASQYKKGGREELAAKEEAEIAFLEPYLPAQVPEAEVREAVAAFISENGLEGMQSMGRVMGAMKKRFGATADAGMISGIAKEILSG